MQKCKMCCLQQKLGSHQRDRHLLFFFQGLILTQHGFCRTNALDLPSEETLWHSHCKQCLLGETYVAAMQTASGAGHSFFHSVSNAAK